MNKHPYWNDQNTRDKLKTLRQEADKYRLLQLACNNSSSSPSSFFQNICTLLKHLDLFRRHKSKVTRG